jgi:hypothetical protein
MSAHSTEVSACPLCGCGNGSTYPAERKRKLEMHLRALESGSARVADLRSHAEHMCSVCSATMTGITSEDDRMELAERLRKELAPATPPHEDATSIPGETGSGPKLDRDHRGSRRDPEERPAGHSEARREKMLDKTLADSFPTSDPPSSIPDPEEPEAEDLAA